MPAWFKTALRPLEERMKKIESELKDLKYSLALNRHTMKHT
ncbi:hypothetical protein PBCVIL52s1_370R [Paramecium bursaria Chlorella virus IL-5-2s1]|nr:hypothetical protein PBCVIL52s1_370R [Paramecium bursaria Chlorella virus IL-5-2s1]